MKRPNITVVILNWRRKGNVVRIVEHMVVQDLVDEILIFNNNHDDPIERGAKGFKGATVINASRDLGLITRFSTALLAKNECILIIDDDCLILELPKLYENWVQEQEILHGVDGRVPRGDNTYGKAVRGDREVPIVLTRCLMMHRQMAAHFFVALESFREIITHGKPPGNGEDILLSYVAMSVGRRKNKIHRIRMKELPAPHAIHGRWANHYKYRTKLMRKCQEWLENET